MGQWDTRDKIGNCHYINSYAVPRLSQKHESWDNLGQGEQRA